MNIIFLTTLNPDDINSWSGTTSHIYCALSRSHNVRVMGQNMLFQMVNFSQANFSPKSSPEHYAPVLGSLCTERIRRVLNCDLIFFGDLYLAPFLEIDIPIVHLSDVSYHLFKNYFNQKDNVLIKKLEELESAYSGRYPFADSGDIRSLRL